MKTASLDYAVISSSVTTELESLRAEKQLLTENIKQTELRLYEISSREEKLARLSESLTALLTVDSLSPGTAQSINAAENAEVKVRLLGRGKRLHPVKALSLNPTNKPVLITRRGAASLDEATSGDSETILTTASPVKSPEAASEAVSQFSKTDREFDKDRFFKAYPHFKGVQQPIHVLAEKVLEYMNRPLKLRDLTGYVLELGYRHGAQNFTNSIHTVLKHKRDRHGSFFFDPKMRMWELGHWRAETDSKENKTTDSGSETAPNPKSEQTFEKQKMGQQDEPIKSSAKYSGQAKIKVIKKAVEDKAFSKW